jgi:zinc transporter ZupT
MNHNKELHVFLAASGGILWTLLLFPFTDYLLSHKFIILAIMSGALLYLALSDILPEVKNKCWLKNKLLYLLFILIGLWLTLLLNSY